MKKTSVQALGFCLFLTCFLSGCHWNDSNTPICRDQILGEWSLYQINNEIVETDSSYCISLLGDGSGTFAVCTPNNQWSAFDHTFTFDEQSHVLTTEGRCYYAEQCTAQFRIDYASDKLMRLTLQKVNQTGAESGTNKLITLRRLEFIAREEFVGLWEGYEIDNETGRKLGDYRRWEYFDDGSFNYYHEKDSNGNWILKNDNNGYYNLYGDFLATSYQNDIEEGTTGSACECWYVNINGYTMTWMANRGGKTHRFRMNRVTEE